MAERIAEVSFNYTIRRDINDNIFPNFNARVMFQTSQFQTLNRFSPQLPKES